MAPLTRHSAPAPTADPSCEQDDASLDRDIARRQSIRENDAKFVTASAMLAELRDDNLKLIDPLRGAKAVADAASYNATSAIIDTRTN